MGYVTSAECNEIRRLARKGHSTQAIAEHLLDGDRTQRTVWLHATGACSHAGGEDPVEYSGRGSAKWYGGDHPRTPSSDNDE